MILVTYSVTLLILLKILLIYNPIDSAVNDQHTKTSPPPAVLARHITAKIGHETNTCGNKSDHMPNKIIVHTLGTLEH